MTLIDKIEDLSALVSISYADYLLIKKKIDCKLIDVTNPSHYIFYKDDKEWKKAKEEYDKAKMAKRDVEYKIYFEKKLK